MIERKAGKVVTLPARHRDTILANNSQIGRDIPVEQTDCRVTRTNRHHVIAAHQRVNFRAAQEKRSLFKPAIVWIVAVTFCFERQAMSCQGTAEPVPPLLVYPTGAPAVQIGEVPATIAD